MTTAKGGLWVWNGKDVLFDQADQNYMLTQLAALGLDSVFLYLPVSQITARSLELRTLLTKFNTAGIKVFALDGWRGFFSDAAGPGELYSSVNAVVTYNASVATLERFYGYQTDIEPHDQTGFKPTFHSGIPDSQLSTTGGGVWKATQALDREYLMRDWLNIQFTVKSKLAPAGLKLAAAIPNWTDSYFGEEVKCTFNGVTQGVMKHLCAILDRYDMMTYNTKISSIINRGIGELTWANTLPTPPEMYLSIETDTGVGANISYGDTVGKQSKQVVLADIATLKSTLAVHPSFKGINVHSWLGWKALP